MANDTAMTCPEALRKDGFWIAHTHNKGQVVHLGLADQAVFVAGELVKDDGNGGMTNGTANMTPNTFIGIVLVSGGSATASANASTKLPVYVPAFWSEFFWAASDGTESATNCFDLTDFTDKNGVASGTSSAAGEVGFRAFGYDSTNGMLYGVFGVAAA